MIEVRSLTTDGKPAHRDCVAEVPGGLSITRHINVHMIGAARPFVDDSRATWAEGAEGAETADYSFVSGSFSVMLGAGDEAWCAYVEDTLLILTERSRRGFAFNLLTSEADCRNDDPFHADPAHSFRFCKENLSRFVTLLHDSPLNEWTIAVRMEQEDRE